MATEIERKFLVTNTDWKKLATQSMSIQQGYFCHNDQVSIRVRVTEKQAWLNFKSINIGIQRAEYDYEIPVADAWEMLESLCQKPIIEKIRYLVPYQNHTWEIDVFEGKNSGLVIAELELETRDELFSKPDWIGDEVTEDQRYYNPWLCQNPYQQWSASKIKSQ